MKERNVVIRTGSLSAEFYLISLMKLGIASVFCFSVLIFALCVGSEFTPVLTVIRSILAVDSSHYNFVVNELRLPRVLTAAIAGAFLAVSGLILQKVIRNPLASPDIIGVSGGAALGAVIFISLYAGVVSLSLLPVVAILGAGIVAVAIYLLAWNQGVTPLRFVLIGIGLSAALGALTTLVIVLSPNAERLQAYIWLTGSVYGNSWEEVRAMVPWVVLIPLSLCFSAQLQAMDLGDDPATGIGVRVQLHRFVLLAISSALTGVAIAFAGGIGFVGLVAPHIAKRLLPDSYSALAIMSAMLGAMIVVIADVVGRVAFLPQDLPAGIFVSGVGAPFFIYLLYRHKR